MHLKTFTILSILLLSSCAHHQEQQEALQAPEAVDFTFADDRDIDSQLNKMGQKHRFSAAFDIVDSAGENEEAKKRENHELTDADELEFEKEFTE